MPVAVAVARAVVNSSATIIWSFILRVLTQTKVNLPHSLTLEQELVNGETFLPLCSLKEISFFLHLCGDGCLAEGLFRQRLLLLGRNYPSTESPVGSQTRWNCGVRVVIVPWFSFHSISVSPKDMLLTINQLDRRGPYSIYPYWFLLGVRRVSKITELVYRLFISSANTAMLFLIFGISYTTLCWCI